MKMRKSGSFVRRGKITSRFLQRAALFFLALTLSFGLAEPGISSVLAQSGVKKFDENSKLDPLKSSEKKSPRYSLSCLATQNLLTRTMIVA